MLNKLYGLLLDVSFRMQPAFESLAAEGQSKILSVDLKRAISECDAVGISCLVLLGRPHPSFCSQIFHQLLLTQV